ncbi:MAG TPA: carboxypeptidase regulatory-like domain-containing protein [Armatimonadota bacterium]|jgi:hypothetical protein
MKTVERPIGRFTTFLLALAGFSAASPIRAQGWADSNYRYRRPLTLTTPAPVAMKAGDVIAFPYVPNYGPFNGKARPDGKDVKIIYYNGSANSEPPQVILPMGVDAGRVLFALQAAVPAPPPYNIQENTNAGKTSYASLAKGPPLAFPSTVQYPKDDNTVTLTLPFNFTLRDQTSNKITVAIDGYIGLGAVDPGRPNSTFNGSDRYIVMPFQSDFAIEGPTQGVYYTADATQAIIKWEVEESGAGPGGPTIAMFACVLKPDGTIRFVYGSPCSSPNPIIADGPNGGYDPQRYGVGVNDPSSPITEPPYDAFVGVDFANHPDIAYTQTLPITTINGYWVYYGYPADTGARTAPTTGLQGSDFSDGALHGWESLQDPAGTGGASADVRINTDATFGSELRLDDSKYHHPVVYWKAMTPVAQGISYTKLRRAGELAVLQRFNTQMLTSSDSTIGAYLTGADIPGLGINWNAWGGAYPVVSTLQAAEEPGTGKRHPGPDGMQPTIRYSQSNSGIYQYQIEATADDSITGHTLVKARAWPSVDQFLPTDPGNWIISADSAGKVPSPQPLPEGKLAIMMYSGSMYLKWAYVVSNPYAEAIAYAAGAESSIPPPANQGALTGTVTDSVTLAGIPGTTVTITAQGGGSAIVTTTDAAGQYLQYVDPGAYTLSFTKTGYTPGAGTSGSVTIGGTKVVDVALIAPNQLPNPGFETVDAQFAGKPRSWYRRNLGGNITPPATAVTLPWEYTSIGAHSGGKAVGISASIGIAAWEIEGTPAGINNADNRGKGGIVATVPGDIYRVSGWVRKSGAGGTGRLLGQPMSGFSDADSNVVAGARSVDVTADTGGNWVQVSTELAATASNMTVRMYGVDIPSGQHVYFDDLSLTRVQPPTYSGVVQDSSGNPMAGCAVGIREAGASGLAGPLLSTTTDGVGRFSLSFVPAQGVNYVVQAWKDGFGASSNTPLGVASATTFVTYDAKQVVNVAIQANIVASSGDDNGGGLVANAVDGDEGSRWINGTANAVGVSPGSSNPAWIVVDLGQPIPIAQISMIWELAKAGAYQIRVSNTAPGANFNAAAAAAYGALAYSTTTGQNSFAPPYIPSQRIDVLTPPSIPSGLSGRYVEVLMTSFGAYANYSLYEMKVEVPIGSVTGRALDAVTKLPIANAYVGPYPFLRIRPWTPTVYVKTDANGAFTYNGATVPLRLAIHKTDDSKDTDVLADPYVVKPISVTPTVAGNDAGDFLLQPNTDAGGSALIAGTTIVIDNAANPGTDTYLPTAATNTGNPDGPLSQLTDGNPTKPWDINASDSGADGRVHGITTGAGYLRYGVQSTLATPANLTALDLLFWQNGYPMGYYVEVQGPGSSTWDRVYEVSAREAGYGTRDDSQNDAWTVNPIYFPARMVARLRVIFTQKSNRSYGCDTCGYGSEVLIGEMIALTRTGLTRADAVSALRIAGGLDAGPLSGTAQFGRLDAVTTGASANRIDISDAISVFKQAQ